MAYKIKPAKYYIPHVTALFLAAAVGAAVLSNGIPENSYFQQTNKLTH